MKVVGLESNMVCSLCEWQGIWWSGACPTTSIWTELSSSRWPAAPTGSPATSCMYGGNVCLFNPCQKSVTVCSPPLPPLCFAPWLDISVKAPTLGWPVSRTCLWRASWSEGRGWSLWEFCLPPTPCSTATCTSWRIKSGKTYKTYCPVCVCVCVCVSVLVYPILLPVHHPLCILFTLFLSHTSMFAVVFVCAHLPSSLPCSNFFSSIKHEPRVPVTSIVAGAHLHAVFCMKSKRGSGRSLDSLSSLQ